MGNTSALTACLLLLLGGAAAQSASSYERPLPQWLTGIIAVCGFLILTFVCFLVKKIWCSKSEGMLPSIESARPNEYTNGSLEGNPDRNAVENPYETSMSIIRPKNKAESYENVYEICDTYETNIDILRQRDGSNIYEKSLADGSEEKATPM